jgi:hypothetical protein
MNRTGVTIASTKGDSTLVQARFGPGMLLHHDDLEHLGAYPRELSRLLFRSFFGCGVVCGLVVDPPAEKCGKVWLTVGAGLALGCSGDPIYVPKPQTFPIDEGCDPKLPTELWVVLCRSSKCCAPRPAGCGDDNEEASSVCTREREGFEIRIVREPPACACRCADDRAILPPPKAAVDPAGVPREIDCRCVSPKDSCYVDHYDGICGSCGDCSDCECGCVVLARLYREDKGAVHSWHVSHRPRRFIRPGLIRDPQVDRETFDMVAVPKQTPEKEEKKVETAQDVGKQAGEMANVAKTSETAATVEHAEAAQPPEAAQPAQATASTKPDESAKPAPKAASARKPAKAPKPASSAKPTTPAK